MWKGTEVSNSTVILIYSPNLYLVFNETLSQCANICREDGCFEHGLKFLKETKVVPHYNNVIVWCL